MKLYIAGPMTGLPEFNYPAFNRAETALKAVGFETRNPTGGLAVPADDGTEWDEYMRRGIRLLLEADGVALLPDWSVSKGATVENDLAMALGMPRLTVGSWIAAGVA
jgi:hypothetical protein